jgi:hypothetical protein
MGDYHVASETTFVSKAQWQNDPNLGSCRIVAFACGRNIGSERGA